MKNTSKVVNYILEQTAGRKNFYLPVEAEVLGFASNARASNFTIFVLEPDIKSGKKVDRRFELVETMRTLEPLEKGYERKHFGSQQNRHGIMLHLFEVVKTQ